MNVKGLKIIKITNPIYRADKEYSRIGGIASNIYEDAPIKYFTLNENELSAYTKYGMPYKKTWEPTEELVLVDILHKPTRERLAELIGHESLNIAFPINGNNVSRVSEEDTKIHDDNVLKAICSLNTLSDGLSLDGYYMDKITKRVKNNNGINVNKTIFHSEVGLCSRAFHKLELVNSKKSNNAPPVNRKKTRNNNNNININRYNNRNNNRNNRTRNNNRNNINNTVNNPLSLSKRLFND
jgi:hypothetical protein